MNFREWLSRFGERWRGLSQGWKIAVTIAVVGGLITLAVLGQILFATPYAPLFTGLDPKDAGKITEELKKENIAYRVADQGKTIQVPEKIVYETRIKLASSGALYSSGVGFELFDEKKFGVTEFEQQVGYQRALQEELRRTIVQIDAVEQARVHLVMPKKSLFLNDETEPSASIAIKLKPTAKISPENVRGIVDLVAGSVEGLKPENIHVIDMQGNSLTDGLRLGEDSPFSTQNALDRSEIRRAYEKELETRIQSMLRQILGAGMAVAMVTADLDFDQQQSKEVGYDKGEILSEHTIAETGTGPGGSGGAPGTDSDLPGQSVPSSGGSSGGSSYSRQENTTNYNVPTKEQTVIKAPGDIRRLSASVVLNGNYSQAQLQQIHDFVATAIGYQNERGDQITVSSMAFDDTEKKEIGDELASQKAQDEQFKQFLLYGAMAVGGLFLLMLLYVLLSRRRYKKSEKYAALRQKEDGNTETEEEKAEIPKVITQQDEVRTIAQDNPVEVSEIIKIWLKE